MKAMDCADYIVDKAIQKQKKITNLQLQKALYVFAAEYIRQCDEYPYGCDKIMAWNYGPVIPEVYHEYKNYESRPITEISKHEEFDINKCEFINHIYNEDEDIDSKYHEIVENNLSDFLEIDIFKVVDFTHKQKFWYNNRKEIYIYDNIEYPTKEINLKNMDINTFIANMR